MGFLVRTPAPHSTESLFGFVLRVSESNGYETPRHMFPEEGFTRGQLIAAGFSAKRFSEMLSQDSDSLTSIAYCTEQNNSRRYKILDHDLSFRNRLLRLSQPVFCPYCAEETGFVESFWDLSSAVACIKHHTWGLQKCQ